MSLATPYICVSHATANRTETERFCTLLGRYGFRYRCVSEVADFARRGETLTEAALLIALTSPEAAAVETVAADIRRALERGMSVLCVSAEAGELDDRFCAGAVGYAEGRAVRIPYPAGETPDRHSVALFIHRLFVRHLSRFPACFADVRCADDEYGHTVARAVHARQGDARAAYALGCAYEQGEGVPVLENEAAYWLGLAAEAGVPDARIRMGELRLAGKGTERDAEGAFRLFTVAAEAGDVRGDYHRGLCYLYGHGVMKDPEQAVRYLEAAARRGFAPALYRLGLLYRDGVGVSRCFRTAIRYLYAACRCGAGDGSSAEPVAQPTAEGGMAASEEGGLFLTPYGRSDRRTRPAVRRYRSVTMRQMRRAHLAPLLTALAGKGTKPLSERERTALVARCFAVSHVRAAFLPEDKWEEGLSSLVGVAIAVYGEEPASRPCAWTESHVAEAAATLGQILEQGNSAEGLHPCPLRARVWYRYAIRRGHTAALCRLGDLYRRGDGGPAHAERAVKLYRLAAERGHDRGRFALAVCCERGIGTPVDLTEAVRRYEQAATAGYAPAQNNLGGCYEHGWGVPLNPKLAVEWYTRAAEQNQPDALCRLGLCYERGRNGVNPDPAHALRLLEAAAEQGHPYATYCLGVLRDGGEAGMDAGRETEGAEEPTPSEFSAASTARLYARAAEGGVPEAAYALSLCYRNGRGVVRDGVMSLTYLRRAAKADLIQACYELGLCCLEGRDAVQDRVQAVTWFERATELWCTHAAATRWQSGEDEVLPADAVSTATAAGNAFYMLGYCALYGIGEDGRETVPALYGQPAPDRVARALPLLQRAAELEHVGAVTLIGDLYAYGLLKSDASTAAVYASEDTYRTAARLGARNDRTGGHALSLTDSPVDALMSLAKRSALVAEDCLREEDPGGAEMARVQMWRCYATCAEYGSADARIGMAECAFFGYGTPENRITSVRFLRQAEQAAGGRAAASLWLGDLLRGNLCGEPCLDEAEAAYCRALAAEPVASECGAYTFGMRCADRLQADRQARAEALYRLAVLRATHGWDLTLAAADSAADGTENDTVDRIPRDAFACLVEAALMGHVAARDDLARMYDYEKDYNHATAPARKAAKGGRKGKGLGDRGLQNPLGSGARLRRRMRGHLPETATERDSRAGRSPNGWLADYYTALWPEPVPFQFEMRATAVPADIPAYATVPVTAVMRASVLSYLGDCLYFGEGLDVNRTAAVACYREVAEMRLNLPRGEAVPRSVVWAQYSYGWCLLHGVGTPRDPRAAVDWLTKAARSHAEACYTLAECWETGVGVDAADDHEAIKYYRKAEKLGYRKARLKVRLLERRAE